MSALDSYLLAVGSVLDIAGVLSEPPEFLEVSDADAIASDWEALGLPIDAAPTDLPRWHGRQESVRVFPVFKSPEFVTHQIDREPASRGFPEV